MRLSMSASRRRRLNQGGADCLVDDSIRARLPFVFPKSRELLGRHCCWSSVLPRFYLPRGVTTLDSVIRRGGGELSVLVEVC